MSEWGIYQAEHKSHDGMAKFLADVPPPPWRHFDGKVLVERTLPAETDPRGATFVASSEEIELINAALYLRRPLLITGKPGTGKSSLAYAVAYQLKLGPVLVWPINTRSTLTDGLYRYDAIARLQEAQLNRGKAPEI